MVLEEILVANIASVVILIILLISRKMAKRKPRLEDKLFTTLIFIGIFAAIFETLSFVIDGMKGPGLRELNIVANSLLYACTTTVSVVWVIYVDVHLSRNTKKFKIFYWPFCIVWVILIFGLVFNGFFEFFFVVDANNVYAREALGYIFFAFPFLSFFFTIFYSIRFRIKHGEAQFFPIWMFLTPIFAGCITQAVLYGISLAWLGCAIGLIGIHINLQSRFAFVDSLTNLYNRAYIEHKLMVARYSNRYMYSGIMVDVDYFKDINDKYGHSVGDEALIEATNILINATDRNSLAFRFAGDEFIILVRVPANKKNELLTNTIAVEERVREETKKFNESGKKPYILNFSLGHAVYNTNYGDDVFFHNMDIEMYREKNIHHKRHK